MNKIPTIFDRDWDGDGKITRKPFKDFDFSTATATEKLDGTNIRLTIRKGQVVRAEKRRNPTKLQKANGILDPWYVDADENSPDDKHIFAAIQGRHYATVSDGEWSAEALGPNIQGNKLGLTSPTVCFFTLGEVPIFEDVPTDFDGLAIWLDARRSNYGPGIIEGVVWHWPDGSMAKIKVKDFM